MNAIIVADIWKNYPLIALIVLAGLQTIPRDLHEAAIMDGAGAVDALLEHHLPGHPRARSASRWCCAPSRPSRCSTSST